jgi:hypothetical protein
MLIKNERLGELLAHVPALLWAELMDWGYVLCVQPRLLAYAPQAVALMRKAVRKRRAS